MGTAIGIIGFLGLITCIIILIIQAVRGQRKKPFVIGIIVSFVLFVIGVSTSSSPSGSGAVQTNAKNSAIASSVVNAATDAKKYKASCKTFNYKDIARNPNNYQGKQAKFTGKVLQVEESWGSDILRINVTKGEYDIWDDTIYVEYTPKSDNESRILENDIVTVYGNLNGIKTYTAVLGNDISVPYLKAEYIDLQSVSSSATSKK